MYIDVFEWIRTLKNNDSRTPTRNKLTGQYYDSAMFSKKHEMLSIFVFSENRIEQMEFSVGAVRHNQRSGGK